MGLEQQVQPPDEEDLPVTTHRDRRKPLAVVGLCELHGFVLEGWELVTTTDLPEAVEWRLMRTQARQGIAAERRRGRHGPGEASIPSTVLVLESPLA